MKHKNDGQCPRCRLIFDRYPGAHPGLRKWFEELQAKHPAAHVSCVGRGYDEQTAAKLRGASRAGWGMSAHNWNAALDLFEMQGSRLSIYERDWFDRVIAPAIEDWLTWYGSPGSVFKELPHVQLKSWRSEVKSGGLQLVEAVELDAKTKTRLGIKDKKECFLTAYRRRLS